MAGSAKTRSGLKNAIAVPNTTKTKTTSENDGLLEFISCDKCGIRVLFASSGIELPFKDVKNTGLTYVCRCCKLENTFESKFAAVDRIVKELLDDNEKLEKELNKTKKELKVAKNEVKELQGLASDLLHDQQATINAEAKDKEANDSGAHKSKAGANNLVTVDKCAVIVTRKMEEKEKRKHNVIVHNIPESSDCEIPKRIEHDATYVKELCNKLELSDEVKVVKFHRLGKKSEDGQSHRPLLIKVQNEEEKKLILSRGYRCRNYIIAANCKQVAVSPDMTKEERDMTKNLLRQLKERKKLEPDLILRGGRIVKKKTSPNNQANLERTDPDPTTQPTLPTQANH